MANYVEGLNPDVLVWARERAGLTVEDAAVRLKKPTGTLLAWETGKRAPTFSQLEHLAESVYHRPIALFFFPAPPKEPDPATEFRTLPTEEVEKLLPDTRVAMREGLAFRESLLFLADGKNPASRLITADIQARQGQSAEALAVRVRDYLGITLDQQFQWDDKGVALRAWRQVVEDAGVFVFKRSFKQRGISGLCLKDDVFPIIMVNNSTAYSRQAFTIFHELGHLLFDVSGITKVDAGFVRNLTGASKSIEVACNKFAAELLVPSKTFPWPEFQNLRERDLDERVRKVATRYRVSREVILRRLLDREIITDATYEAKTAQGEGNYYRTQVAYLGPSYLSLGFGNLHAGRVTLPELADHFSMKASLIPKLETYVSAEV